MLKRFSTNPEGIRNVDQRKWTESNKMVDQNSATLITLNVSELNTPTKSRMVKLEIKKK